MTTITVKDNIMSSDGQTTVGECIVGYDWVKIKNIEGYLVGGAGRAASVVKFQQWFEHRVLSEVVQQDNPWVEVNIPENMVEEDFQALVLTPDGELLLFEGGSSILEWEQPSAIGSGEGFALAAMKAGASAEEAVEIAKEMCPFTGGKTTTLQLEEVVEPLTKEVAMGMAKDELINAIFGEEDVTEVDEPITENDADEGKYDELVDVLLERFPDTNIVVKLTDEGLSACIKVPDEDKSLTIFENGSVCVNFKDESKLYKTLANAVRYCSGRVAYILNWSSGNMQDKLRFIHEKLLEAKENL